MLFNLFYAIAAGIIIVYTLLQTYFWIRFKSLPEIQASGNLSSASKNDLSVSIIVPFRNEASGLERSVKSLLRASRKLQHYEIILIDDHSTDQSSQIAEELTRTNKSIQFLYAKAEGKKQAIAQGIAKAKHEWIFTADADCIYADNSISNLLFELVRNELEVGTFAVVVDREHGLLNAYQQLESFGLMMVTAVALKDQLFYSASGAALLYRKSLFQKIQPFKDNYNIPTGDDVFFLYAYKRVSKRPILFYKNRHMHATTEAMGSWRELINQRLRWAVSNTGLKDMKLKAILGIIVLAEFAIILLVILLLINIKIIFGVAMLLFFKWGSDFISLHVSHKYWGESNRLKYLIPVILIHPVIHVVVGLSYIFNKKISWKKRPIKLQ